MRCELCDVMRWAITPHIKGGHLHCTRGGLHLLHPLHNWPALIIGQRQFFSHGKNLRCLASPGAPYSDFSCLLWKRQNRSYPHSQTQISHVCLYIPLEMMFLYFIFTCCQVRLALLCPLKMFIGHTWFMICYSKRIESYSVLSWQQTIFLFTK